MIAGLDRGAPNPSNSAAVKSSRNFYPVSRLLHTLEFNRGRALRTSGQRPLAASRRRGLSIIRPERDDDDLRAFRRRSLFACTRVPYLQ